MLRQKKAWGSAAFCRKPSNFLFLGNGHAEKAAPVRDGYGSSGFFSVEQDEALVVVGRVVDQPVVGKNDALRAAGFGSAGVDVALGPFAPLGVGQLPLVVAEVGAADGLARRIGLKRAACPAQRLRLLLGDVVGGQMAVGMDVQRDLIFRIVFPVLRDRGLRLGRSGLLRRRGLFGRGRLRL